MPHPHGCFYTTSGQLLVPDLACDQVAISEAPHHTLEAHGKQLKCRPGSGPRHLALHPNSKPGSHFTEEMFCTQYCIAEKHAYVLGELDNTVTVHDLTNVSTEPNALPSVSVLPDGCNSSNDASSTVKGPGMCASAILLTPDAHHLYITNRLDTHEAGDAITWLQVSEDGTSLQRGGSIRTGLKNLRGAEIFQVGGQNFVITGARGEKGAVVYQCDDNTGALKEVARNQEVDLPSCFVPMQI